MTIIEAACECAKHKLCGEECPLWDKGRECFGLQVTATDGDQIAEHIALMEDFFQSWLADDSGSDIDGLDELGNRIIAHRRERGLL